MPKISILMPVYNAAKYLDAAINSVLNQSFTDWELLCVDDDSTDNSWSILKKYKKKDPRIKAFHQSNTGPMGARRLAFEQSTGVYIIYLDADDLFSTDLLEGVYKKAIDSNADAIAPDMVVRESNKLDFSWNKQHNIDISEELSGKEGFMETFPWRKLHNFNLWSRNVFKKSAYHPYLEGNNFNADEILQRILLLNCNKIVFASKGAYIHTINTESITHILSRRSFNRLSANDKLIQLGIENQLSEKQINKIFGFAFFCELKSLMLSFIKTPQSIDKKWALTLIKEAFKKYTQRNISDFYGISVLNRLKAKLQTCNFSLFYLTCYLQIKFRTRINR